MSRTPAVGDTVAGYLIESVLGRGGMAVVYLSEHERLKRKVALKVLTPEIADDETFRRRFVAESERLASVDHPNIIPIYEAGQDGELLFIAMRYVDSTDLKHLIAQEGGLDAGRTVSIVTQVAGALDAAHAKGLVHRDVKPANVLVAVGAGADGGDHAYLSDFGLTKRTEETSGLTRTGYFMGTIDYVAPEQITGKGVDGRTDQYALACVLFECLTAQPPYRKEDDAAVLFSHLSEPPPRVTDLRPELSGEVNDVIATGMAKEKEDRYPYCLALARAARAALTGRPVTPPAGVSVAAPTLPTPPSEQRSEVTPTYPPAPAAATQTAQPPAAEIAPPDAAPDVDGPPATHVVPPDGRRSRALLVVALIAIVLIAGAIGLFALLSDGEERAGQQTGATGSTGATGTTAQPSPTDDGGLPLAESHLFGTWDMTFTPQDGGAETTETWTFERNCESGTGPHPCDADAVAPPVSGFLRRLGKTYSGTMTGELPCGSGALTVEFEVLRAQIVEGIWRAAEIAGDASGTSGECSGAAFTVDGTLA